MPSNESQFDGLLINFQKIIGKTKSKWKSSKDIKKIKRRGGISSTETSKVLDHYNSKCNYTVNMMKRNGVRMNLNAWLKTIEPNKKYIVHTGQHAIFVDVPKVKGKWKIYDQVGPRTKTDLENMKRKGGLAKRQIESVFTIFNK